MSRNLSQNMARVVIAMAIASFGIASAHAQPSPPNPQPQPAPLPAVVTEVEGNVDWAAVGVSPTAAEGWTAVKLDDQLKSGTQIRTGLRSHVNLKFGETTAVSLRSATFASLDQLHRSANVENVRIGLGYGTVRGGSSEGTFRSDVIVDSPVATLAKRGTEGWEIEVEAGSGRFRVSLAEFGLVQAIQRLGEQRTRSKLVRPGEYATEANIANLWLKQDIFNRSVVFYSPDGVSESDAEFTLTNARGMGVVGPGGGTEVVSTVRPVSASFVMNQIESNFPSGSSPVTTGIGVRGPIDRPEGNFGTGLTFRPVVAQAVARVSQQTRAPWFREAGPQRLPQGVRPQR